MGAARTAALFALAWLLVFSITARIVTGLWPGALTGGLKILGVLALAPALLGAMGETAVRGPVRPPGAPRDKGTHPHTYAHMDTRPGTVATRQAAGNDTLWVRLAPNPDYMARDSVTGRSTGTIARRAVAHEVEDGPTRRWLPAWMNMIRPWRTWDAPSYGNTLGVRYGDARSKTGYFG